MEEKTRLESHARISNQLRRVTDELEDAGSWCNQRTQLAREIIKARKEEKKNENKLLNTRPGFAPPEDAKTTPAEDDDNDEWDIIDSLEIPDLEMPSTSNLPLIDESVLAKTYNSCNPGKKFLGTENMSI